MFPMSSSRSRMESEPADGSKNVSNIDPADSSSTTEKNNSSTIDFLIKQSEILLKNNFSAYDICIKYQENLRLQLLEAKEDFKQLREWIENVNEDCFRMKSNDSDLTQIYKTLLKNNLINDFVEHGVARERLNLKFLRTMIEVEDMKKSLSAADGNVTSAKSDYEEMQYLEVLLQITCNEDSLKYAQFGKELRLKSSNVLHECERLNTCLKEACEKIIELKSQHDELTRSDGILLKNATVKEFINCAKHREKLLPESPEKLDNSQRPHGQIENESSSLDNYSDKSFNMLLLHENQEKCATNDRSSAEIDFFSPSTSRADFCEDVAPINVRLNECEEKLIAEQRSRELSEEKCKSLDEFSDKLCHLLLKYQKLMSIQNSAPFLETSAAEIKEKNNERDLDEDELHLDVASNSARSNSNTADEFSSCLNSNTSTPEIDGKNNEDMDACRNGHSFPISSFEKDRYLVVCVEKLNLNMPLGHHSKYNFDNYGSCEKKSDPVASNHCSRASDDLVKQHHPSRNKKRGSMVKNQPFRSSSQVELRPRPISNRMSKKRKQPANRQFYCNKCDKPFVLKKNQFNQKCSTCGARKNTIISKETKPTINKPISSITKSNSVTENSSTTGVLCNICNRYYANKSNLRTHKRLVHEGRKEFKCSVCDKMLNTKHSLKIHVAAHSSLKPYKCSVCNRCYPHPFHLKTHMRFCHSKQRFKCSVCGRMLSTKQYLKLHVATHSSLKPYKCPVCNRCYPHPYHLKRHMRQSHPE